MEALNEMFSEHDLDGNVTKCEIPIGTTVGIYKDSNRKEVTEYWYINDTMVVKSFEDNYFVLKITNNSGYEIESLQLGEQIFPSEINIKKVNTSTNEVLTTGILKYSVDGGELKECSSPLSLTDLGITVSLDIYWYVDNQLLAYKQLKVSAASYLKQSFYLSYTDETLPKKYYYIPSNIEADSYQSLAWTPNTGEDDNFVWRSYHTGILKSTPYEFVITRERVDGHWEKATEPAISARWGVDGVSTYDRQAIYTLNDTYDQKVFVKENETLAGYTQALSKLAIDEAVAYINNITSNLYYTEANKPSPTPEKKYLWCRVREAYADDNGVQVWGTFSKPSLYSNFAEDGKDGDTVEYIYSRTTDDSLSTSITNELTKIKEATKSCTFDSLTKTYTYWTDDAQGVGDDNGTFYKTEWCSKRTNSNGKWGEWCTPFKWAVYGDTGNDGAGIEYAFLLTTTSTVPTVDPSGNDSNGRSAQDDEFLPKTGDEQWTDNYTPVSHAKPYSWFITRKGYTGHWSEFTTPQIWMQYEQPYELFLDNDVTQVPATKGVYTKEALIAATLTGVTLKRGNTVIPVTEYTIKSDCGYKKDDATGKWYTDNTSISFGNEPKQLTLTALLTDGDIEVASRAQTVSLVEGGSSYKLSILPNSRIWYGGTNYSTTTFKVEVKEITVSGDVNKVVDPDFTLKWQSASGEDKGEVASVATADSFSLNKGNYEDIYCHLYYQDKLCDTETIDTVNYELIKGKDASAYTVSLWDDNTEIAYSKRGAATDYLKEKLHNRLQVYQNTTLYNVTSLEVDPTYGTKQSDGSYKLNYISTITTIDDDAKPIFKYTINENYVDIWVSADTIYGDLRIPITVTINVDGTQVSLDKVWSINLGDQNAETYSLHVVPQAVYWCENSTSFDTESIACTIVNDTLGAEITSNTGLSGLFIDKDGNQQQMNPSGTGFDIGEYYSQCEYGKPNRFIIQYRVNDVLKASQDVEVLFQQSDVSTQFVVDLNNSIVRIPNGASSESIKAATSGIAYVYYNNKELPILKEDATDQAYSFTLTYNNKEEYSNEYSFTKEQVDEAIQDGTYPTVIITIYKNGTKYTTIEKKVVVQYVDSTTYQFVLVPSSFTCAGGNNPDFSNTYIKIQKFVSGEKPEFVTDTTGLVLKAYSTYQTEQIEIGFSVAEENKIQLEGNDLNKLVDKGITVTSINFDLYYNEVWQDGDTATIVRNGKDVNSSSTYYIKPNVQEIVYDEVLNTYNTSYLTAQCIRYLTNEVIAGNGAKDSKAYLVYHATGSVDGAQKILAISANRVDGDMDEVAYKDYADYKAYNEDNSVDNTQKISSLLNSKDLIQYDAIYIDVFDGTQNWGDSNDWFNGTKASSSLTIAPEQAVVLIRKIPAEYSIVVTYGEKSSETSVIQYTYSNGVSLLNLDSLEITPMMSNNKCSETVVGYYYTANSTTGEKLTLTNTNGVYKVTGFEQETQDVIYLEFKIVKDDKVLATKIIDVKGGNYGNQGVTVRTFYSVNNGGVYRDDSNISRSEKKIWDSSGNGAWVLDENDSVLYKDYVAFIDSTGEFHPFVCKKTFRSNTTISGQKYESYYSGDDNLTTIGKDIDGQNATFSDVFDKIENLGNGFFETISVLSGNIQQLSSSTLNINGQLLMKNADGETIGGINGEQSDVNDVSKNLSFWSGGTGSDSNGSYDATFAVTKDGKLYAKEGNFQGVSGGVNISQPKVITPNDMKLLNWNSSTDDTTGDHYINLNYSIDIMKTGLNLIINDVFVEKIDKDKKLKWGYSVHSDQYSEDPKEGWLEDKQMEWKIIPLELIDDTIATTLTGELPLAQLCLYYTDENKDVFACEFNKIKITFYVDLPSYNNEHLGSNGVTSDKSNFNDGWTYLKNIADNPEEIRKYKGYCDAFLGQQLRLRCVTPGKDVVYPDGTNTGYHGDILFDTQSLKDGYAKLKEACKENLSLWSTVDIKFRGIPKLALSTELFDKKILQDQLNFTDGITYYDKSSAELTSCPDVITSTDGITLLENYLHVCMANPLLFIEKRENDFGYGLTSTAKTKFGINDSPKSNDTSVNHYFINGVDTWESIDKTTIINPKSTYKTSDNNITTCCYSFSTQGGMKLRNNHDSSGTWPGIDIIVNCYQFSEMFGGKTINGDEVYPTNNLTQDGGIVWIPTYIGNYSQPVLQENNYEISKTF